MRPSVRSVLLRSAWRSRPAPDPAPGPRLRIKICVKRSNRTHAARAKRPCHHGGGPPEKHALCAVDHLSESGLWAHQPLPEDAECLVSRHSCAVRRRATDGREHLPRAHRQQPVRPQAGLRVLALLPRVRERGLRIPRVFDPQEQQYHVYGWFCSANCAKAYILEHSTFDRGYQMNIFVRMLRQVYKIETAIDEAPPRLSLKMFGGPFDIEAFRKETNLCTLVTPPFVSYSMLIEERTPPAHERQNSMTRGTVRGLKRPTQRVASAPTDMGEPAVEGQYAQYLRNKRETSADAPANGSGAPSAVAVDTAPAPATAAAPRRSATGLAKFAKR